VGLTTLPCKKKIVEKPPRNSAGFFGGGHDLRRVIGRELLALLTHFMEQFPF
jgi:hypothetical protein